MESMRCKYDKLYEEMLNQPIAAIFPEEERPKLIRALKKILQKPDIRKISLYVAIDSREVLTIISLLKLEGKIAGYLIALEEEG